jgi:hypothetical protein
MFGNLSSPPVSGNVDLSTGNSTWQFSTTSHIFVSRFGAVLRHARASASRTISILAVGK